MLLVCFLALVNLSQAVTLELTFDQETFDTTTTGTFRLYGAFGMNGYGYSQTGSTIDYYIFGGTFRGSSTPNLPSDLYFWMESYSATGTATRDGLTHSINTNGRAFLFALSSGGAGYTPEPYPWFQLSVDPTQTPGGNPFAGALVDVTGTFSASKSGGSGISYSAMDGTYQPHEYDPQGPDLTITTVPEPSTLSLLSLAAAPLLIRRRKSS